MFSKTIRGRLRILDNKEMIIERQSTNILIRLWLLIWYILKWPIYLCSLSIINLKPDTWFITEYSVYDNYMYFLINKANKDYFSLLKTHEEIESFKVKKEKEIEAIKANSNVNNLLLDRSEWMNIPKHEIPFVGRMKKPEAVYLKGLSDKVLKKFQKGRKFAKDRPEYDLPTSDVSVYTIGKNVTDDINRSFKASRGEDDEIDNVMTWKMEDDKKGQQFSKKKAKGESDEGHRARMQAIDNGTFDPKTWPWQKYKVN